MKTMFITFYPEAVIKPVEVARETKHALVLPSGMTIRKADQLPMVYHRTWGQAHAHLVKEAETDVNRSRQDHEKCLKRVKQFRELQQPEVDGNRRNS